MVKNVTVQSSDEIRTKNDQSSDSKGVNHDNVTEGEPEDGTEILPVQSSMEKIGKKTVLLLNGRRVTVAEDAQTEKSVPFVESLPGSRNRSSAKKESVRKGKLFVFNLSFKFKLGSLSKHDDDGNKNPTNLHI